MIFKQPTLFLTEQSCIPNHKFVLNIYSQNSFNPIPARGGGVLGDNSKSIGLRLFKFSDFTNYHMPLNSGSLSGAFLPTVWVFRHTASKHYFSVTRLNLYLDPLPVIGFRLLIALWKALNKRKQIAEFCEEIFFAQICIKREFAHFQFSLNKI